MAQNLCIFTGNLTAKPELKYVTSKKGDNIAVINFRIAMNNRQAGTSAFATCEAWGSGAEAIAKYFKKGDLIRVYSELITDSWEDEEGNRRFRDKYRVIRFEFPEQSKKPIREFAKKIADAYDIAIDELMTIIDAPRDNGSPEPEPKATPKGKPKPKPKEEEEEPKPKPRSRTRPKPKPDPEPKPEPEDDSDADAGEDNEDEIPF